MVLLNFDLTEKKMLILLLRNVKFSKKMRLRHIYYYYKTLNLRGLHYRLKRSNNVNVLLVIMLVVAMRKSDDAIVSKGYSEVY